MSTAAPSRILTCPDSSMASHPHFEAQAVEAIRSAAAAGTAIAIAGGGSKAEIGRSVDCERLDMTTFSGIVDYDPSELVLTVGAGTRLSEIESLLAPARQMLAFNPFDHGPLFGREAGAATIGGIVAAGVAGSRRVSAGGARDHVLGIRAITGRGDAFVAGGRVVKNVTGFDVPRLAARSWGRLFALTEISLRVLPRPDTSCSLAIRGLAPEAAVGAMNRAMGSAAEVAAAAHRPPASGSDPMTVLRLEGFGPSVEARAAMLASDLRLYGDTDRLAEDDATRFWEGMHTLKHLPCRQYLWRVVVPPRAGARVVAELADEEDIRWLMDWAGGLIWICCDPESGVRKAAARAGGHAMLVRAPSDLRFHVPAFHPAATPVASLEERVRRAFDPSAVFETGRF